MSTPTKAGMIPPHPTVRPDTAARRAAALRRAAVHAARAPSVLNTQPWKLRIRDGALYVHADHRRQLAALDPHRRVLTTSIGCAVFNARAALAADGYGVAVTRFPQLRSADLIAIVEPDPSVAVGLTPPPPASSWVDSMHAAMTAEGVCLRVLDDLERERVSELNRHADEIQNLDPTYRAELDAWTSADGRDRVAEAHECFAVLLTDGDEPLDWLRAGEAMMRARQIAALAGRELRPSTQVIEVASARAQLRRALRLRGHAQMLLRVGSANTAAVRRRLVDVLVEES